MNAVRYTEGPWRPEYTGYNDMDDNFDIEKATIRGAGNLVVAEVEPHHASVADVVANAHLIAAAPELLEALKRATDMAAAGAAANRSQIAPDDLAALERFRAAIAKAEGR